MPIFNKGGTVATPFGKNAFLRSTRGVKFESYTCAATAVPSETIDGYAGQKILQAGEVMAKITSAAGTSTAADVGKVGPFQAGVTDGRQTLANIVGLNDTFLPWQFIEGDREIAVVYVATAVQGWCFERDSSGARIALTNTTADAMRGTKGLDITFK